MVPPSSGMAVERRAALVGHGLPLDVAGAVGELILERLDGPGELEEVLDALLAAALLDLGEDLVADAVCG